MIWKWNRSLRSGYIGLAIAVTFVYVACSNISQLNPTRTTKSLSKNPALNIWWEQGYNLEEDRALRAIVDDWQSLTGNQARLSFYTNDELTAKAERAVEVGNPPDLMMNHKAARILYPRLAWQGKLEDVSDTLEPIKDNYPEQVLKAITYRNSLDGTTSYYGVPIHQAVILIFYWQQLLTSVGLSARDIPQDWQGFWQFWQQVQTKLKTEQNRDIYGLGLTLSADNSTDDTHYLFEQILEAYDIALFDERGKLKIDRPEVRQGIIDCLNWYSQLYQRGYVPPDAVAWSNADNNRSLLNQLVLMTPNASLSIPATVNQDADTYYDRLGVVGFPNKPSGKPMRYLISVGQAVIFSDAPNKALAKDFLRYFIQPEVAIKYFQASGSRYQPVQTSLWLDPYWQNSQDPYIVTATEIITQGSTRLSYVVEHPAYSQVLAENIWGKALTKVILNHADPVAAADEAIARIQEIFAQWQ